MSGLKKKVPLPLEKVLEPSDVLQASTLLTLVKMRGLLFNRPSRVELRRVVLLTNGMLLVYEKETEGWTASLRAVYEMKTKTTAGKRRTLVELKVAGGGKVTLVAGGTEQKRWLDVLSGWMRGGAATPPKRSDSLVSLYDEDGVLDVQVAEELGGAFEEETPILTESEGGRKTDKDHWIHGASAVDKTCAYHCAKKYEMAASDTTTTETPEAASEPEKKPVRVATLTPSRTTATTTTESAATESIRHGERSVATLRNILEARTRDSLRKTGRRSQTGAVATAVVVAEEKKKMQQQRLGRSVSAPAGLDLRPPPTRQTELHNVPGTPICSTSKWMFFLSL